MNEELKTSLIAVAVVLVVVAALGSVFLLQPAFKSLDVSSTSTSRPCYQRTYFNGQEFCFEVMKANTNASQAQLASVQIMYVVTYPQLNSLCKGNVSSCKPQALPSGYSPQCNPCVQEAPALYHDHILSEMPSTGSNLSYAIVIVAYNPAFSGKTGFTPLTSASAIIAGEGAGDFAKINPTGANSYEMHTRTILVLSVYPAS